MKTGLNYVGVAALAAGFALPASAALVFSEIQVGGTLAAGGFLVTPSATDLDISFDAALVGDTTDPIRSGDLSISFIVTATEGQLITKDILSILGATEGRGLIDFKEVIEDLTPGNEGEIASISMFINSGNPPPTFADLVFTRASSKIKVTKTATLSAPATTGLSLASVDLIEQTFVPSPGTLSAAALGLCWFARRRRA